MRRTKIIVTVGPSCEKEKVLKAILAEGADVFRINASHTTPEKLKHWILLIRKIARLSKKNVAVMVDLQGPRVRTGLLLNHKPLNIKTGQEIVIRIGNEEGSGQFISTSCREFRKMVKRGDPILIDNGALELVVVSVSQSGIKCRIINGGSLGENKGINLPNAPVTLPALTKKDLADLKVASGLKVDYIALSFVRSKEDILVLRKSLRKMHVEIPIIAKIEKPRSLDDLDAILRVSDGVMVARGDLGIEIGVEKVPAIQKRIINRASSAKVPVVVATQMLESMMEHSRPTRAEASDVANAVFDGADAVMLSGETAIGRHPIDCVHVMSKIIVEAEKYLRENENGAFLEPISWHCAIAAMAKNAARALNAKAIAVFTFSGKTALLVSKYKSDLPIIAFTHSQFVCARLSLLRGVKSILIRRSAGIEKMLEAAESALLKNGLVRKDDTVVFVSGRRGIPNAKFFLRIHSIGEKI